MRALAADDLDPVAMVMADPEVMRWLGGTKTRTEAGEWLERHMHHYSEHGYGRRAIVERETGEFVGCCGPANLQVEDSKEIELGWWLTRDRWGRGYATEAAVAARDHAFLELGIERLVSLIIPANSGSVRVAMKLGALYERDVSWAGEINALYVHRLATPLRADTR